MPPRQLHGPPPRCHRAGPEVWLQPPVRVPAQFRQVMAAVEAEHSGETTREELIRDNEALRRENAPLWDWLFQTIEFPLVKQQEFAVTALAMGLSLNQLGVLLAILLGTQACPSRSTLHRWVQAAATAAGRILQQRDRSCQAFVLVGSLDEIFFHRRPVLVGVEPHSMVWFVGKKADNCQGATWFGELKPWSSLHRSSATRALDSKRASPSSHRTAAGARASRLRWRRRSMSSTPSRRLGAGPEDDVEAGRAALGAGRGRRPSGGTGPTAGPRRAGCSRHGPRGLEEGVGRFPAV